jgi:hypothetical protein
MFRTLPPDIQRAARKAYILWRRNPSHASLQFKRVHPVHPIFSVRISLGWRACGAREGDTMIWFFIGSHAAYDHLVAHL